MQILRVRAVAERIGISTPTVWRWAKNDPNFPQAIKISAGITGWVAGEIDAYLERRIAASRPEQSAEKKRRTSTTEARAA